MPRARYGTKGVLTRHAAKRILRPYAKLLAMVVFEAWETWNNLGAAAPLVRVKLGRGARAMNVSDFIKDEIVRRFDSVGGCEVSMQYGRPVLVFAGGDLMLRLGKIDLLNVPPPRNARQLRIWSQADAVMPVLPGMPSATWAKCGYVLDETETSVRQVSVVCDMNGEYQWVLDLPMYLPKQPPGALIPITMADVPPARIASARQAVASDRTSASSDS